MTALIIDTQGLRRRPEHGMQAVICLEPGRLALVERPVPGGRPGLGAGRHQGDRHLRHRFPHLRGQASVSRISPRHGPRALRHRGGGLAERGPAARHAGDRQPLHRLRRPASPAARASRTAARACKVLGVHIDGGMCERIVMPEENLYPGGQPQPARCGHGRVPGDRRPRGSPLGAARAATARVVVGAGPIGVATALFARLAGADVAVMDIAETAARLYRRAPSASRETILAGTDAGRRDRAADRRRLLRRRLRRHRQCARHGGLLRPRRPRRQAGHGRRAQGRHHLLRRRVPQARDDACSRRGTPRARISAPSPARSPTASIPLDALNTHSGTLAALPEAMPAWLASSEPPLKAIVTV